MSHFEEYPIKLLPLAAKESVRKSRGKHKRHQCYLLEMKDAIQVALFRMMPWQVSRHSCLQITAKLLVLVINNMSFNPT